MINNPDDIDDDLIAMAEALLPALEDPESNGPMIAFRQVEEVRQVDPGEPLEPEDEVRFTEATLQSTGLGMPGCLAFCKHAAGGYWAISVDWSSVDFHRLWEDAEGWRIEIQPKPAFWAMTPNISPDESRPQGGMVQ